MSASPWPTDLRWDSAGGILHVSFDDGSHFHLSGEYLRVESPSAEVQGHAPSQKQLVSGKAGIGVRAMEPVGNYAVKITFDDGHDTGLYSWAYLYELGREQTIRWPRYLAELAAAGKSRQA